MSLTFRLPTPPAPAFRYLPSVHTGQAPACQSVRHARVRFLTPSDVPALLALEQAKWQDDQQADEASLVQRMARHPHLCLGAFCQHTGAALASLFMKPTQAEAILGANTWQDCVRPLSDDLLRSKSALFGISLSSTDPQAAEAIFEFFWPYALKAGWKKIYLGSPIPGLRKWMAKNPGVTVESYVRSRRGGLPLDPQLRYYFKKGFREVVAVRGNYFPHHPSLDYGVLIAGKIPLSGLSPLWQRLPLTWLQRVQSLLFFVL